MGEYNEVLNNYDCIMRVNENFLDTLFDYLIEEVSKKERTISVVFPTLKEARFFVMELKRVLKCANIEFRKCGQFSIRFYNFSKINVEVLGNDTGIGCRLDVCIFCILKQISIEQRWIFGERVNSLYITLKFSKYSRMHFFISNSDYVSYILCDIPIQKFAYIT